MIPREFKCTYYDKKGEVIDLNTFAELCEDFNYKVVKQDEIGDFLVSTIWLGIDHNFYNIFHGHGKPLIFETMIFSDNEKYDDIYQERYSTEEEALEGHKKAIKEAERMAFDAAIKHCIEDGKAMAKHRENCNGCAFCD